MADLLKQSGVSALWYPSVPLGRSTLQSQCPW